MRSSTGGHDLPPGVRRLLLHSRTQMAVKAALAAALSWVVAEGLTHALSGLELEAYVYYAPLGAVVATYPTVVASVRTARSTLLALAIGAVLGLAVHSLDVQGPLALAVVVGLGVALGALPGLGGQNSWVPIVALFVLIIGGSQAFTYAVAYVLLTGLGMLCGVAVNLALPALRLTAGQEALARLRDLLARQLVECADLLRRLPERAPHMWQERLQQDPVLEAERTREALQQVLEASRWNPRARFHTSEVERQRHVARGLQRVAVLVEDLPEMLVGTEGDDPGAPTLDRDLAAVTADALDRLADLVRAYDTDLAADDPRVEDAEEAVRRLMVAFGQQRVRDDADIAIIGAVVASLRRSVAAVAPAPPQ